jgi:hypothetical protein
VIYFLGLSAKNSDKYRGDYFFLLFLLFCKKCKSKYMVFLIWTQRREEEQVTYI